MEIRPIAPQDDRMAISRVYETSWRHAYRGVIPQDYLDGIPRGRWSTAIDAPGRETLLLLDGESIVGVCSFGASRLARLAGWGEIISIYLLPESMGKGFGTRLFRAALSALERQGYRDVFLWVLEENRVARRFYERMGFAPVEDT